MRPAASLPLAAAPVVVPPDLTPVERAKWDEIVAACPWIRVEHADTLRVYVALWGDWVTARTKLGATGGPVIKGTGRKPWEFNPYVQLAKDAMQGLLSMQSGMLFAGTREGRTVMREQSKLEKFLAAKSR